MSRGDNDVSRSRQTVRSSTTQTPRSQTEHVLCNITADNIHYREAENSNQSTLNHNAKPFKPFPSKVTNFLKKIAFFCSLPSIEEEHWEPTPLKEKEYEISISIPHNVTEDTFAWYFHEYFRSSSALFNRAFYRCTMQIMDEKHKLFTIGGEEDLFIFNTELHTTGAKHIVYVVGSVLDPSPDATSQRIELEGQFMTAAKIQTKYGIQHDHLPKKLKLKLPNYYERDIIKLIDTCGVTELNQIGRIYFKRSSDQITVTLDELRRSMKNAIDVSGNLYPIICFDKRHESYSTEMLLRIQLKNFWVGLSFRYCKMGKKKNNKMVLQFHKFCLDNTDIQRKLSLFKPCVRGEAYPVFSNCLKKINIDFSSSNTKLFPYEKRPEKYYQIKRRDRN